MDGTALKAKRESMRMSQKELAEKLGVSQMTVSRWETGKHAIEHPEILELALDAIAIRERLQALESVTGTRYLALLSPS